MFLSPKERDMAAHKNIKQLRCDTSSFCMLAPNRLINQKIGVVE